MHFDIYGALKRRIKIQSDKYNFIPSVYLSFLEQFVIINFLVPLVANGQRIQVIAKSGNNSVNGRFDDGSELLFELEITCFRAVLFRRDRDSFVLIYGLQKKKENRESEKFLLSDISWFTFCKVKRVAMIVGKSFCTTPYRSSLIEDEIRKDKPAKKRMRWIIIIR